MENNTELQDSLTPESEESLESLATPEATQEVATQELVEKNKKLFARAKKAEEDRKSLKEKLVALEKKEEAVASKPTPANVHQSGDEIEDVLNLRSQGYSDAEVLTARKYAKRMNTTISEVLNDTFFKAGIDAQRTKAKSEQATPAPSNRTSVAINSKNWESLSPKERQENISQAWTQKIGAR